MANQQGQGNRSNQQTGSQPDRSSQKDMNKQPNKSSQQTGNRSNSSSDIDTDVE